MSVHLLDTNALFLHIPKTGGLFVEAALKAAGIRMDPWPRVRDRMSARHAPVWAHLRDYDFVFAFVRHPLAWFESWWRFQQAKNWQQWEPGYWHPQRCLEPFARLPFPEYVEQILKHQPGYVTRLYEWMMGPPDAGLVQFVGHQESLVDDLCHVLRKLGYKVNEERIRSCPPTNVGRSSVSSWSDSVRQGVLAAEAALIEQYYSPIEVCHEKAQKTQMSFS